MTADACRGKNGDAQDGRACSVYHRHGFAGSLLKGEKKTGGWQMADGRGQRMGEGAKREKGHDPID